MSSLALHLEPFLSWLLRTTWQAGILIGLILLIQRALGDRLGPRGRYCLWFLLLIRLGMPWMPSSRFSVYNFLPPTLSGDLEARWAPALEKGGAIEGPARSRAAHRAGETASLSVVNSPEGRRAPFPIPVFLSLFWLVGAGTLASYIIASHVRLGRVVRCGRPVTDREILRLLEDCKRLMGTRVRVDVVAVDGIGSPALFGVLRPRLLLPGEMIVAADRTELRHIFLHELAHLTRYDILTGHIVSALHVLHWFNPVIAFAFQRMRADREVACDSSVLSVLQADETVAYGRTVVHQIEQLLASRWHPLPTGVCGVRARIRHRIAMIARHTDEAHRWSPLAMVLVAGLAWVGLTNGHVGDEGPAVVRASAEATPLEMGGSARDAEHYETPATVYKSSYAHVIRVYFRHLETGVYLVANGEAVIGAAPDTPDAALWEARFDRDFGHGGTVYFWNVATEKYLTCDDQGNTAVTQADPDAGARWIVKAGPLGVQVISEQFKDGYLRLDEQGQIVAPTFGRDVRSQWDIMQLDKIQ